jgi:hypothetical protein
MRFRLLVGAVGVAMGAFGLLRFLQHDFGDIVNAVLFLGGGVVVHDGIIAPLTIALTFLGTRVLPSKARVATVTGLVVLFTVTVTAIPVLGAWGRQSSNPSLLDRHYVLGWCVFALLVLAGSLLTLTPAWRRLVERGHEDPHDDEGGA